MTETSQRIYEYLLDQKDYVPAILIAQMLGFKDERGLRAGEDDPGVLVTAGREIWEEKGLCLVTRMRAPSGLKLTKNPEEIRSAVQQWIDWFWPIKAHKIDYLENCLKEITQSGQIAMAL